MYKKTFFITFLIFSFQLNAEIEKTLIFDIPLANVGGEIGQVTEGNHYFSFGARIGLEALTRFEVDWTKSNKNRKHWLGAGLGLINADPDVLNVDESDNYYLIRYKYFRNSIDDSGFAFFATVTYFQDDSLAIPWIGVGKNF